MIVGRYLPEGDKRYGYTISHLHCPFARCKFYNHSAMAEVAYEDVYLTVLDIDGIQWADKLRSRMRDGRRDMRADQVCQ